MSIFLLTPIHAPQLSTGTLSFEPEYRLRFERRLDRDFNKSRNDNRSDLLSRLRLGLRWQDGSPWSAFGQYQYSQTTSWTAPKNSSTDNSDLYQLYLAYKQKGQSATLGRQKIQLGSERLIGASDWNNVGRTFDALRVQTDKWDVFAGRIGVQTPYARYARLAVASYRISPSESSTLIYKHDGNIAAGDTNEWTLSQSYRHTLGPIDLETEDALQLGRSGGKDQSAWAVHLSAGHTFATKTTAGLELNSASGGSTSSTNRTFDNLYPTNHKFYGNMDMFGWKNIDQLAGTVSQSLGSKADVRFRVSKNWLRDNRDAWYSSAGTPNKYSGGNFVDATGVAGKDLGWEYDVDSTFKFNANASISGGIGVLRPGNFVEALTKDNRAQFFGYVQLGFKF